MSPQDAAWDLVFESLPPRWRIGRGSYDPDTGTYSVAAMGPYPGRGGSMRVVTGTGCDVTAALIDLDAQLLGLAPEEEHSDDVWRQARLAYYFTAEKWSRATSGRALTNDELEAVLQRYSGN